MQKLIAKYGLAAHLALLAVAPLFLFPFFAESEIATVMEWLSLFAVLWLFMSPSVRGGEMLHQARKRVVGAVGHDPLFWVLISLVLVTGVRALNGGIELGYDAETISWFVKEPVFPILPGVVAGAGGLPFAGVVALTVLIAAVRHALGKSARMALLFMVSFLAGLVGIAACFLVNQGQGELHLLARCAYSNPTYVGTVFGVFLVMSTAALMTAIECQWTRVLPLCVPAIAGNAAGLVAFAPPLTILVFASAEMLVFLVAFLYACFVVRGAGEFKLFVFFVLALVLAAAIGRFVIPRDVWDARIAAFVDWELFPVGLAESRAVLSKVAFRAWISHLWVGSGIGSFPLDIRFNAVAADWPSIAPGTLAVANGWWLLLAERGVLGAAMLALVASMLALTYCRRLIGWFKTHRVPRPTVLLAPVLLVAIGVITCYDCSFLRVEVLMAIGMVMALSAAAFPREKR